MRLPRNGQIWLPDYVAGAWRFTARPAAGCGRVWLAICDHWEPYGEARGDLERARSLVGEWTTRWPAISRRHTDSAGHHPCYTFFYPAEEYEPELLKLVEPLVASRMGEVEVHLHHDGDHADSFRRRVGDFVQALASRHGMLHYQDGRPIWGFIHGNWALDNSRPDGRYCGLNDEITLLAELGCYADFTMPSAASPTQARTINRIYWAVDDPLRPRSFDHGTPVRPGAFGQGDLLMIPGPLGLRWRSRLLPRLERGEVAGYDPVTDYRVQRWLDLAPAVGDDIFVKLFTHGAQPRNLNHLLADGLDRLYSGIDQVCRRRGYQWFGVSAHGLYEAVRRAAGAVAQAAEE